MVFWKHCEQKNGWNAALFVDKHDLCWCTFCLFLGDIIDFIVIYLYLDGVTFTVIIIVHNLTIFESPDTSVFNFIIPILSCHLLLIINQHVSHSTTMDSCHTTSPLSRPIAWLHHTRWPFRAILTNTRAPSHQVANHR